MRRRLPTCHDGCDGSLDIAASGGNNGYQYQWANGTSGPIATNLCAGNYNVQVMDSKSCNASAVFAIENTPPLDVDLGGSVTLCVGQTHTLDAGSQWVSYQWNSNTGFVSDQRTVTVSKAGKYTVDVVSSEGCPGSDTFLLETSYDLLKASFMVSQEAFVGDTVVVIDISWPLPETIDWSYPQEMSVIQNNHDVLFGRFLNAGVFEIGLTAHLGECVDNVKKKITILENTATEEGGRLGYEEFVKEFTLHPNPTDGSFDVSVELAEQGPVVLSIWNTPTNYLIKKVYEDGETNYHVYFDLRPLSPGTYVLRLDHAKGKDYIRFIVR